MKKDERNLVKFLEDTAKEYDELDSTEDGCPTNLELLVGNLLYDIANSVRDHFENVKK